MSGSCQAVTGQLSGSCQVVVRQLSNFEYITYFAAYETERLFILVTYNLTWLYAPIAAGAVLVLIIILFNMPLELMIIDDLIFVLLSGSIKSFE